VGSGEVTVTKDYEKDTEMIQVKPIVVLEGVRKSFGTNCVLEHIDLSIPRGQIVALIGPSGSGKTTLLRSLNGLERIDSGKITVSGVVMQDASEEKTMLKGAALCTARANIGFVFQQFNLFPQMSVLENVVVGQVTVLKRSKASARVKALELLSLVGLQHKADSPPSQLSGGQQQRVAIARTLAMDPEVILLDEITSALDPQMTIEVLKVVRELGKSGITMVLVTHEMNFARHVANRVVFMNGGRIIEDDKPERLLDHPRQPETAAFIHSFEATED